MATNTTKGTKKTTTKKTTTKKIPHVYKEHAPDNHKITGKFVGLYVMFAITTLIFAALSVYLFIFSSQVLEKYEKIDAACRNGNCEVIINTDGSETINEED